MNEKIIRTAVIGVGGMGRGHVNVYKGLQKEGFPVKLVAICDVDQKRLDGGPVEMNLSAGGDATAAEDFRKYLSADDLFANETDLDYVDIVLPTYLHASMTVKALQHGLHVFCEKPMALDTDQCQAMIDAARKANRQLMIGQCLRFWPEYEILKEYVAEKKLGDVVSANFFRGGTTPKWSFENWYLRAECGGGALFDQHVHDVDMVNYLFGTPKSLSTSGINCIPGSGWDACSTTYFYDKPMVVTTHSDWTLKGKFPFTYYYRVNFERGTIVYDPRLPKALTVYPEEGEPFTPEYKSESAYKRELSYFIRCLQTNRPVEMNTPEDCMETIRIVKAEAASAAANGQRVDLR